MGGDITGKLMIPIVKEPNGDFEAIYADSKHVAKNEDQLHTLENAIRFAGFYPHLTDSKEMAELEKNEKKVEELFHRLMMETVKRWVDLAEQHLKGSGI